MHRSHFRYKTVSLMLVISLQGIVAGCSSHPIYNTGAQPQPEAHPQPRQSAPPQPKQQPPKENRVVEIALSQLNRPYRYGGYSPQGFDCSGLVYFAFNRSGVSIPRTSREQYRLARPISTQRIQPGDLLFFRIKRKQPSHVGIYIGSGQFIHASTSERIVRLSHLQNPYWQQRLISAGRF